MGFKFRAWMPMAAVLIVLLSIVLMFIYGVPAVRARLGEYIETQTFRQAAAAAEDLSNTREANLQGKLELLAETTGGEILVVDTRGRVVAARAPRENSRPPARCCKKPPRGAGC